MAGGSRSKKNNGRAFAGAVIVLCVLMIVPALLINVYYQTYNALTTQKKTEQQTLVDITSLALKLKIDALVGIATSMAGSSPIVADAQAKQWTSAADVARDLQNNVNFYDPFIDRVVVYDSLANQQAAYPTLTGSIGTNFASSSWYQTMKRTGQSFYVSGATKRRTIPQIQVINIVSAIKDNNNAVLGYIDLQIPTKNFLEFGENLSLGTYGFAYVVDASGNLVAHPRYSSDENTQVISFSSIPVVRSVISGLSGGGIINDPVSNEKSVVTYKQVPQYGWGIITQEPYDDAFNSRDGILLGVELLIIATCAVNLLVTYIVFRIMTDMDVRKKRYVKK